MHVRFFLLLFSRKVHQSSQGRGLSGILKQKLGPKYRIYNRIFPGRGLHFLTRRLSLTINSLNLGKNDVILILGGSNDIPKFKRPSQVNLISALSHIRQAQDRVNIILSEIPPRFDLPPTYQRIVLAANEQFSNILYDGVTQLLPVSNFGRKSFGKSGLHYSHLGKIELAFAAGNRIKACHFLG